MASSLLCFDGSCGSWLPAMLSCAGCCMLMHGQTRMCMLIHKHSIVRTAWHMLQMHLPHLHLLADACTAVQLFQRGTSHSCTPYQACQHLRQNKPPAKPCACAPPSSCVCPCSFSDLEASVAFVSRCVVKAAAFSIWMERLPTPSELE